MSRDEVFEGDGQASTQQASFEQLEARWRDPRQVPAREPSPQLLASVRRIAHLQLGTAAGAEPPPPPSARAGGARRGASSWALTAAMVAVVAGYVGWAVAFASQLYP